MDYLFFAANAICFAATVLLLFWRMSHNNRGLRLSHWIIAILAGAVFYVLNQNIFSRLAIIYFVINIAVPLVLLTVIFFLFWPHDAHENQ